MKRLRTKINKTTVLLVLVICPAALASGHAPSTFMGHRLGETYQQTMHIVKATKGMSVIEAGRCGAQDQPDDCLEDKSLSGAIETATPSRAQHLVGFDFVDGKLTKIDVAGCGSGISQVRLLEEKFGKYNTVKDMPFRNTTGSLLFDKGWYWWLSDREDLYVLEDIGSFAVCGGTAVTVIFEKSRPGKAKVANPY